MCSPATVCKGALAKVPCRVRRSHEVAFFPYVFARCCGSSHRLPPGALAKAFCCSAFKITPRCVLAGMKGNRADARTRTRAHARTQLSAHARAQSREALRCIFLRSWPLWGHRGPFRFPDEFAAAWYRLALCLDGLAKERALLCRRSYT